MSDMTKFDIMPLTESDRGVASYLMIYSAYEYLNKLIPKNRAWWTCNKK